MRLTEGTPAYDRQLTSHCVQDPLDIHRHEVGVGYRREVDGDCGDAGGYRSTLQKHGEYTYPG